MLSPRNTPIWQTDQTGEPHPPLRGDRQADVTVVGAGIAGLTTALLLARAGVKVIVLEARTIGSGTTGHTTAKVSALQGVRYKTLASHHNDDVVARYAAAQTHALRWVASTVDELGIDCDWERRPAFTYASQPADRRTVEAEFDACERAGLPVTLTDDPGLPFANHGAVALNDQAQFNPQRYLEALAVAVESFPNATLHEGTRVTSIGGLRRPTVKTDEGTVRSGHVAVCTLLPIVDRGLFFARSEPKMSYIVAAAVEGELPHGMYLSAGDPSRSLRTAPHDGTDVLLVGGSGHTVGRSTPTQQHYDELDGWTIATFPTARVVGRWAAHDMVPDDQLPWAGPSSPATPNVLVAGGFAKWGMTNGTAAAQVLVDRILSRPGGPSAPWASVFDTFRIPPRALGATARINAGVAANLVGGWLRPRPPASEFPVPEGSIRRRGLVPTGTSSDDDGDLEERKLVCTHLGGICTWNDAERTWDCPLHGSRFTADGSVLTAPATKPLP